MFHSLVAEMIASGDRNWKIGGWCIFVGGCCTFLAVCGYVVFKSVHRKQSRLACWALLAEEEEVRCFCSFRVVLVQGWFCSFRVLLVLAQSVMLSIACSACRFWICLLFSWDYLGADHMRSCTGTALHTAI